MCTGAADISGSLDAALHTQIDQGFEKAIATIEAPDAAVRTARELQAKLATLTQAYDPLVEDVIKLAEGRHRGLSSFAKEDAGNAELRAGDLYSWASTFLPGTNQALSRSARLEMMPYIVCMAYAVRVKLDAHLLRSHLLPRSKRAQYLQRAVRVVEDFVQVLNQALSAVTASSSLLDVALDFELPVATYATLITTLRDNVQEMLLLGRGMPSEIAMWDDGLSGIR